jgi:hypothetical protein
MDPASKMCEIIRHVHFIIRPQVNVDLLLLCGEIKTMRIDLRRFRRHGTTRTCKLMPLETVGRYLLTARRLKACFLYCT